MKPVAVGVDIGGTNTVFGIVDQDGNCLIDSSIPTKGYQDVNLFLKALHKEIKICISKLTEEVEVKGIGVGAPNGNFYTGTIEFAPNLEWKGLIKFVESSKQIWNIPTFLTNDANAAAIGEMIYGGAKWMKDFIMITLGTGLGSGLVANGVLIYGHDGFAGEVGHVIAVENGRECGCGRKGCLETYGSATGICRTVFELLADSREDSELRNISFNDLNSKKIFEAAKRGDKIALKAFDITGEILGKCLADAIAYTSPEAIFLFGGLAQSGDFILKPTNKYMQENVLAVFKNKTKLLLSKLDGAKAAVLGSSALVWKELQADSN